MLLEGLAEMLEGRASGMEISFAATQEEHETLFPFLDAIGFQRRENHGETIYLTTLADALDSHLLKGSRAAGTPFSQIDIRLLKSASKTALATGTPLPAGGLDGNAVDLDASVAVVENGQIQAYAVFDTTWTGGLVLAALWSKSAMLLPGLVSAAISRVKEKYSPETRLAIQAVNSASVALLSALLPKAMPVSFTYYYPFY